MEKEIKSKSSHESIRESIERQEEQFLHRFAVRSSQSKGRLNRKSNEKPCPLRTCFQRDKDRILHSKAFRRLKHKTQVFISPSGDHYRTRLTHTLEVAQVSRTIARALRLNEDLTEAIALGHDLGHPPFGHNGEEIINEFKVFHHEQQSVRIANLLEPMNLSFEVLDGMGEQKNSKAPQTLEAQVVKIADRMTYLHHDVEDATRAGLMQENDLPKAICDILGETRQIRLDTMVIDLVQASQKAFDNGQAEIIMTQPIEEAMNQLRKWMFKNVYLSKAQLEQKEKVRRVLSDLYGFYSQHPQYISENIPNAPKSSEAKERRVVDYIAGMTDRYAIAMFNKHLLPTGYDDYDENPDKEKTGLRTGRMPR